MDYCPNCNYKVDTNDNYKCPKCGQKFWVSQSAFENRPDYYKRQPEIIETTEVTEKDQSNEQNEPIKTKNTCFQNCLITIAALLGFSFIGWLISIGYSSFFESPFPELAEPKSVNYSWGYEDRTYTLNQTLYKSVYDFYKSNDENRIIAAGDEENSIKEFLDIPKEDDSIQYIANALSSYKQQAGLTDDQIAELATVFVQTIPYDYQKAVTDIYHPRDPYEVLYEQKGLCSGKTFLLVAILDKLGYGTAVFDYFKDKHVAAGVQCPIEYSTYGSGFCVIESTITGWRIGTIPEIEEAGIASSLPNLQNYSSGQGFDQFSQLSQGVIRVKKTGKQYNGIIRTKQIENEIISIINSTDQLYQQITVNETLLNSMLSRMNDYKYSGNYWAYNNQVPRYNNLVYQQNSLIDQYNANVARYDVLLKEYEW